MSIVDWALIATAFANALGAILAWVAKIRWSSEFGQAKDETIKAKQAQIELLEREVELLNELTPMKIREYFLSVREQLEEYNNLLQAQLESSKEEIQQKSNQIDELTKMGDDYSVQIEQLNSERSKLQVSVTSLEGQITDMRKRYEGDDETIVFRIPKIDTAYIENINKTIASLTSDDAIKLNERIRKISADILRNSAMNNLISIRYSDLNDE